MSRFRTWLAAAMLLALTMPAFAQTPHQDIYDSLTAPAASPQQDDVDAAQAVIAGFGNRIAIGPHRDVTLLIRQWRADMAAAPAGIDVLKSLQATLGRGKLTPCQKATMAVIALEMVNSFSPGTIPPQVLAMAIQLQQAACAKTPAKAEKPCPCGKPLAPPAKAPNVPNPKAHATGLKILPEATRKALHVREALIHREFHAKHGKTAVPTSVDLRSTIVTAVKDQGPVGTCHDFSGVCVIESANIAVGNMPNTGAGLSEQYIVDLNPDNDGGCQGGDASTIFQWLRGGNGIPRTANYAPYTAACNQGCQLSTTATGLTISDWGYSSTVTGPADVLSVQETLALGRVVSVCIGADSAFQGYGGGIYTRDLSGGINHQVAIVGYVIDAKVSGGGYWILRNSWGTGWGESGYARVAFSANPTTESMWVTAKKGQTTGGKPWGSPQPPQPTPTRRASVFFEKATAKHAAGSNDPVRILTIGEKLLVDPSKIPVVEKALQNAP